MGLPPANSAYYPTADELRQQMLAEIRWGYAQRGLVCTAAIGSELYIRCDAFAKRIAIAFANNKIALVNYSPLTATGDVLAEIAARFGVTKRPGTGASGYPLVQVGGPAGTFVAVPAAYVCTGAGGIQYETTGAFVVLNGQPVEITAKSVGLETNLPAGTELNWDLAGIPLLGQTVVVGPEGLTGGNNADTDEDLRRRLLRKLSQPAVGGNEASVCQWSEECSAAVDVAFCYPAVRGPSSYDVAIMQTDTSSVLSLSVINTVSAYLGTKMPGSENRNVTTVFEQLVDVVIDADLPMPVNAGGAGGGWRDVAPWPSSADAVNTYAEVLSHTPATSVIVVNSTAADAPAAGKHIAFWNPIGGPDAKGAMVDFVIKTVVAVGPPHYTLTLDCTVNSLDFVVAGMLVSAGAVNLTAYARAFRDAMALMGPGEKTANVDLIPTALRYPGPDIEYPYKLTSLMLDAVSSKFSEVEDLGYAARYVQGTGESGTSLWTARSSPSIPATTAQPPRILKLGNLSFRRKV